MLREKSTPRPKQGSGVRRSDDEGASMCLTTPNGDERVQHNTPHHPTRRRTPTCVEEARVQQLSQVCIAFPPVQVEERRYARGYVRTLGEENREERFTTKTNEARRPDEISTKQMHENEARGNQRPRDKADTHIVKSCCQGGRYSSALRTGWNKTWPYQSKLPGYGGGQDSL